VHLHLLEGGRLHGTLLPHDQEAKAGQAAAHQDLAELRGSSLLETPQLEGGRLQGMLHLDPHEREEAVELLKRNPHGMLDLVLVEIHLHPRSHEGRAEWLQLHKRPSRNHHPGKRSRLLITSVARTRKDVIE